MILDIVSGIFNGFIQGVAKAFLVVLNAVLDIIFTLFGGFDLPAFSTFSTFLNSFWELVFQFVGYIRSIFLIDSFSMNIILLILLIKLTYKPLASVVKMFIKWFSHLKG